MSWKKSKGGYRHTWVGYEVCLWDWTLGISEARAAWVHGWLSKTLEAMSVDTNELREALGRMVFVYGALVYDRPFLAPLFALLPVSPLGMTWPLPLYALVVLKWLLGRLQQRRAHPVKQRAVIKKAVLRVDAKAEGLSVAVGSWSPC